MTMSPALLAAYMGASPVFNVKDFGASGEGKTIDDTRAIQSAIDVAKAVQGIVFFPVGVYLVTQTLTTYNAVTLLGTMATQSGEMDLPTRQSRINFAPATPGIDCIAVKRHISTSPLITAVAIQGLAVISSNKNGRYGLNLKSCGYSNFRDLHVANFETGIYCSGAINNRFENVMSRYHRNAGVIYAAEGGTSTTDVWDQCSFKNVQSGALIQRSIALRFTGCLFEECLHVGIELDRFCENVMVTDCYSENVPFANPDGTSPRAMFRVGHAPTDTSAVVQSHLTITGGKYAGRNPTEGGAVGCFLDCDASNGVQLNGPTVAGFTNPLIRTTENTRSNSILVSNLTGIGWTSLVTELGKLAGAYPTAAIGSGGESIGGRFKDIGVTGTATFPSINLEGGQIEFPARPNLSAHRQTLDDYRECPAGGWTPAIRGATTRGSYDLAKGTHCTYTRVGDLVTVFARIMVERVTAAGKGDLEINGLPFAMNEEYTGFAPAIVTNVSFKGSFVGVERLSPDSGSAMRVYGVDNKGTQVAIQAENVHAGSAILFTLQYKAS